MAGLNSRYMLNYLKKLPNCFFKVVFHLTLCLCITVAEYENCKSFTSSPTCNMISLLNYSHSIGCWRIPSCSWLFFSFPWSPTAPSIYSGVYVLLVSFWLNICSIFWSFLNLAWNSVLFFEFWEFLEKGHERIGGGRTCSFHWLYAWWFHVCIYMYKIMKLYILNI